MKRYYSQKPLVTSILILMSFATSVAPTDGTDGHSKYNISEDKSLDLPENLLVSADAVNCETVVTYDMPVQDSFGNTYAISQLSGLPSGSTFPLGSTTNSFRIVADQGTSVSYDFENLTAGQPINGQDNWQVLKTGTGSGANINMAVVKSLSSNGGYAGSTGLEVEPLGGNNQLRISRIGDVNFSFPEAEDDDVIEIIFDQSRNHWGAYLAFGYDTNSDGHISDNEITFGILDRNLDDVTRVYGPGLNTLVSSTKPNFGWTQWKVTIDLTGNGGSGSISVAYRDLVNDGVFITPSYFQNLNPGFDLNATDNSNPVNMNGMLYRHGAGNTSMLDNIQYTVKDGLVHDFSVNVEDTTAPTVITKPITIELDENGQASVASIDVDNGSNDACGNVTLSLSKSNFDCSNLGDNIVWLTAVDEYGNEASANAIVSVVDNIVPQYSLTADLTVSTDPDQCNASVVYTTPFVADNCETFSVTQIDGLPSGSTFPLGSTTNSFRIVADQGTSVSYDFENLTAGQPINGQDNWQVLKTGTGSGANINMAVVKSLSSNGGYAGSTGLEVEPLGGNNQLRISRIGDVNFSFPEAEDDDVIEIIFDQSRNHWGAYLAFGYDTNSDGHISDNEITFGILDRNLDDVTRVYGPGLNTLVSSTKPNFGWTQWKVTIDLTGNGGSGSISVAYRDLVNDGVFITPSNFQNLNPGFDLNATDNSNPVNMNGMLYRHGAGGASMLDNIQYTVKDGLTHSFDVNVNDQELPVLTGLPVDIDLVADTNTCSAVANWDEPIANDNCTVTLSSSHNSGDQFPVGVTTVTYTAIDPSGNSINQSFEVTVSPSALNLNLTVIGDAPNASIDAEVLGGCAPYNYQWNTGQSTEDLMGLEAGNYTLTVIDANGTTITASAEVEQVCDLEVNVRMYPRKPVRKYGDVHTIYLGYGAQTVLLKARTQNGERPYAFNWTADSSIKKTWREYAWVSPKETTTYEVTVTDQEGCKTTESFTVKVIDIRCNHKEKNNKKNRWNRRWKQPEKVHLCHNGKTICVSAFAVNAHLRHGDSLGTCDTESLSSAVEQSPLDELNTPSSDLNLEFGSGTFVNLNASPNPVKDRVTVSFSTPQKGAVRLAIYNMTGVEVAKLYEKELKANEEVEVAYEADALPNGIYIIRLVTGSRVKSIKLMVRK